MSAPTITIITGANRGIGLGLLEAYLSRDNNIVVGIVRSTDAAAALQDAAGKATKGVHSSFKVVVLDFTNIASPETALNDFATMTGNAITHANNLICSAGHVTSMDPVLTIKPQDVRDSIEVNTIGPLNALQTLWPLLAKTSSPKFVILSSSMGSIGGMEPLPGGAYGPSKAATNHLVKGAHFQLEQAGLVAIALHPGWVKTGMGQFVADQWGFAAGPPDTVQDSVKGILNIVDGATRETWGGKFVTQKGQELSW